jgi:hypothetical protein
MATSTIVDNLGPDKELTMRSQLTNQHADPGNDQNEKDAAARTQAALVPRKAMIGTRTEKSVKSTWMKVEAHFSATSLCLLALLLACGVVGFAQDQAGQQPSNSIVSDTIDVPATAAGDSGNGGTSDEQADSLDPGIGFTAHCFCQLGYSPNPAQKIFLEDFGAIKTYRINNKKNRDDCSNVCWTAAENWVNGRSNRTQACTDFYDANNRPLTAYYHVGTDSPNPTPYTAHPADVGYPNSCGTVTVVHPRYWIADVIYPPPGCTPTSSYNCASSPSTVLYYQDSKTGITTTMNHSVKNDTNVTASLSFSADGTVSELGVGWDYSGTSTNGEKESFTKDTSYSLLYPSKSGPLGPDGLSHKYDLFKVLVNPGAMFANWARPRGGRPIYLWTMGYEGAAPYFLDIHLSWLMCRLPSQSCSNLSDQMPVGVQNELDHLGLTYTGLNNDYETILSLDPFWDSVNQQITNTPSARFTNENFSFNYQPVGNGCAGQMTSVSNETVSENSTGWSQDYTVDLKLGESVPGVKLGWEGKITWTNSISQAYTTDKSQKVTIDVECASPNWLGPLFVDVYYDPVWASFPLVLSNGPVHDVISHGQVLNAVGRPASGVQLDLLYANTKYHTFTDKNGNFTFNADSLSPEVFTAQLSAVGAKGTFTQDVSVGATTTVILPSTYRK